MNEIYTVTTLNQAAHNLLDIQLGFVRVQGEISNLKKASSGHYYFSLKDNNAQVNCVFFSSYAAVLDSTFLANGRQVIALAKVGLYQPRGDYQLNVKQLDDAGTGLLQIAFDQLKKSLAEQGLFDPQFKRLLPKTPHTIGIVTSLQGAAVRDILATLKRRFIAAHIIIYPTEVQGQTAAPKIAKAIQIANLRKECDVLIVARGGGSMEDLWPFNEEVVAWAIFNSEIPIVTGIGHQVDTTIADYVADYVASTPTAAAEAVAPHQEDWLIQTQQFVQRMNQLLYYSFNTKKQTLAYLIQKLQRWPFAFQEKGQTLDRLTEKLHSVFQQNLSRKKQQRYLLEQRLHQQNPSLAIHTSQKKLLALIQQLQAIWQQQMHEKQQRFSRSITALNIISPLATLERGYALALSSNNTLLRHAQDAHIYDKIIIQLAQGKLYCTVDEII